MSNEVKQVSGGATIVGERFEAPRPAYQAPVNAGYTTPTQRDNTPAKSLVQKAKESGSEKLAALIAKAEENAKKAVARAEALRAGKTIPSQKRVKKSEAVPVVQVGHFNPEDVCDEKTFIIRTRSSDIHSEEMKRLFWANGGKKFIDAGLGYASAYANLRNEKMKALNQKR